MNPEAIDPVSANSFYHYMALALCIVLTSIAQLLLKFGASNKQTVSHSFVNRSTLGGYGLLAVVTIISVYAMQVIELKVVTAWVSATYLLVVLLARTVLKEPLTIMKMVGCGLITLGGVIFSLA